jgi:hypothetical protein
MKVTYKEIADLSNKKEPTIKSMAKNNPEQLELMKLGAFCKKYKIELKDLEAVAKLKESI